MKFLKNKKPPVYWLFWLMIIALIAGITIFAWYNIEPYQKAVMALFKLPRTEPGKNISIFWLRFNASTSWLIGAITWLIMQTIQVSHLMLTQSTKALDFIVKKAESEGILEVKEKDSEEMQSIKNQRNKIPLSTITSLGVARAFCYSIELCVSVYALPWITVSGWEFMMSLGAGASEMIDWTNIVMTLMLMFAVESMVFFVIVLYKAIEAFNKSGAYKRKNPFSNKEAQS